MTEPELTPVQADPSEFLFIPSTLVESPSGQVRTALKLE